MTARAWRHDVVTPVANAFALESGPCGSSAKPPGLSPGFAGTTQYADLTRPGSHLTVDRFADEDARRRFLLEHAPRRLPQTRPSVA
jgi:hypothetical protein